MSSKNTSNILKCLENHIKEIDKSRTVYRHRRARTGIGITFASIFKTTIVWSSWCRLPRFSHGTSRSNNWWTTETGALRFVIVR